IADLHARVRVLLRGLGGNRVRECFTIAELEVALNRRLVTVSAKVVQLTPTESVLMTALVQADGKVLTHHQLLLQVWGSAYATENHMLHVNISNLRKKIESDPERPTYILTEPRVGYRLGPAESEPDIQILPDH